MAEFCKSCYIKYLDPLEDEDNLVVSEDEDYCEGCGKITPVVIYIKKENE